MLYQAFFFDFDGVLADSVEIKTRAFARLFEPFGIEVQARVVDHHRKNGGMTRKEKFKHYYAEFLKKPLLDTEIESLCNTFSSLVVNEVAACPEIPGAKEFLDKWHRELPCFVVSATPDEELLNIVEQRELRGYFLDILGSSRSKQENLEALLKKYELQPGRCMFFGDAESDYRAAEACNVKFIAIVPGPDAPLLQFAPAVTWAKNFRELINYNI